MRSLVVAAAGWLMLAPKLASPLQVDPARLGHPGDRSSSGQLLLRTDAAATLFIDGERREDLAPGEVRVLCLAPGPRRLSLVTSGGEATWAETVEVSASQKVRLVRLAALASRVRQDYVRQPAGAFAMGCVEGDAQCADDEKPRHEVTISRGFWIMRTEVTVEAYRSFAQRSGRELPAAPPFNDGWSWATYPMVNVSWADAAAYCEAAGGRLPSEAEWEYAARAGHTGGRYVWGDDVKPMVDGLLQANVADQRGKDAFEAQEGPRFTDYDDGYSYTAPVLQYAAHGPGPFDMAGNVWEWCADWYGDRYYEVSPTSDPQGPATGSARVLRGGAWSVGVAGMRTSNRHALAPHESAPDLGFRCVRELASP